jgi:putative acetyltransferase
MIRILEAATPAEIEQVRSLFREYEAEWAEAIGERLCFQRFDDEVIGLPGKYLAPAGRLLLAEADGQPVGCVGMRPLDDGACEMKRLYVRPGHRGRGIGVDLVARVMELARGAGYRRMRLDTVPEMTRAIRLYRSMGFEPIGPYWDNRVAKAVYFEATLVTG